MFARSKKECVLRANEILCVPISDEHINDSYVSWMNDPEINCFLESRFDRHSLESLQEYYLKTSAENNVFFWAIQTTSDELRHIGNIKLNVNIKHRRGEIGIIIGNKNYWGRGVATTAIKCVSSFSFNSLGLHKLTAGAYSSNAGSIKAFIKAGFKIEYSIKEHFYIENGFEDCTVMSLIGNKW